MRPHAATSAMRKMDGRCLCVVSYLILWYLILSYLVVASTIFGG